MCAALRTDHALGPDDYAGKGSHAPPAHLASAPLFTLHSAALMADDDLQSVSKAREKELQSRFTALRHTHSRMEFLVHDFAAREASIKAREEDLNVRIKYAERLLEEVATKEGVIQQRETVVEARERAANDRNIDLNNREAGLDFLTRSTLSRLREIEDFWTLPDILEGLDTEDPDIECDSEDAESDVDEAWCVVYTNPSHFYSHMRSVRKPLFLVMPYPNHKLRTPPTKAKGTQICSLATSSY